MNSLDIYSSKEAIIKIVGVGGAGGNTINSICEHGFKNVDLIAANTDLQVLRSNRAPIKIAMGMKLTKGLGVGGNPEKGKQAALESINEIENCLKGADLVIITAGMGGGTGSGASSVFAQTAKKLNSLVMIVVTKPFRSEGEFKSMLADKAIDELKQYSDAIIVIPNDRLLTLSPDIKSSEAYKQADNVLIETITGITDVITTPSMINVDFADIESIIKQSGTALVGIGKGKGERRHMDAIKKALTFPLIENADIQNAKGLIVYFKCSDNFKAKEHSEVMDYLNKKTSNPAIKIKYGQHYDNSIPEDEISITLIAAGFGYEEHTKTSKKSILEDKSRLDNNHYLHTNKTELSKPAYLRIKTSILD